MDTTGKRLVFDGRTYEYKYAYKKDGVLTFVCDTTELGGERGDEVAASEVDSVSFADGSAVEKPEA